MARSLPGRLVDLSHSLLPGKEEYHIDLQTHFTDELYPQYKRSPDTWYILQDVSMSSHTGTHVEFPYHHKKDGADSAAFPLDKLVGDCVVLDFRHKQPGSMVEKDELAAAARDVVRTGDMVLFNFNCARFYRTERSHDRPQVAYDALEWLIREKKITLIGTDASGIELKGVPDQPCHQLLMDNGIPIIEFAAHLDDLRVQRFTLFVLAIAVKGLDSCPVRLVAIEPPEAGAARAAAEAAHG